MLHEVKGAVAEKKMEKAVTPPPIEFTEALKNKGFEDSFLKEYKSEIFSKKNLERFSSGDPELWEEIENYHDEWTYFNSGCTGDDDIIVAMTNEAWMPDEE